MIDPSFSYLTNTSFGQAVISDPNLVDELLMLQLLVFMIPVFVASLMVIIDFEYFIDRKTRLALMIGGIITCSITSHMNYHIPYLWFLYTIVSAIVIGVFMKCILNFVIILMLYMLGRSND